MDTVIAQFTLNATESKWLIAHCVYHSKIFNTAMINGRILFKGSTTVSCLAQLATDTPLRICGRITHSGMKSNKNVSTAPHFLLYEDGALSNIDATVEEVIKTFTKEDLFVMGANAIDAYGHAALLIGAPAGGGYGKCIGAVYTEGFKTLILATADKLIPGDLSKLYSKISRKGVDYAYGMACGLAPIEGDIITQVDAIKLISDVEALIFSAGGHTGTQGSSAIQIMGAKEEVEKILKLVDKIRKIDTIIGEEVSLKECTYPSMGCGCHLSCAHANKNKINKER